MTRMTLHACTRERVVAARSGNEVPVLMSRLPAFHSV